MSTDLKESLAAFSDKLGFFLGSGVPLMAALETIAVETPDPIMADATRRILHSISSGSSFCDALASVPTVFSASYISMARAGENQGTLDVMMPKIAQGVRDGLIPFMGSMAESSADNSDSHSDQRQAFEQELFSLLQEAVDRRASHLILVPLPEGMRVRFRVDNVLVDGKEYGLTFKETLTSCAKYKACLDVAEHMLPQDGRMVVEIKGKSVDIRVNVLPTALGETITMRLLIQEEQQWKPEVLFPNPDDRAAFQRLINSPFGLVVIAGPHGSGKMTTAYHALQQLREKGQRNLATVEAPYEMILPGIAQTHVRPHLGLTCSALLAAIDRGDPDVIYVSDIPDEKAMDRILKLALTGHLIFVTMHASSVEEVIGKLLDLKAPPHLLASALTGVVVQQLARKVCPSCAVPARVSAAALKRYGGAGLPMKARLGKGCEKCNQSGYRGRLALYEIFTPAKTFKDTLQTGDRRAIGRALQKPPRRTLLRAGAEAVAAGTITLSELERISIL